MAIVASRIIDGSKWKTLVSFKIERLASLTCSDMALDQIKAQISAGRLGNVSSALARRFSERADIEFGSVARVTCVGHSCVRAGAQVARMSACLPYKWVESRPRRRPWVHRQT